MPNAAARAEADEPHQTLRRLGARAHQLRAMTRAADHFHLLESSPDSDTCSWLMSSAVEQATELAAEFDSLARVMKERPSDALVQQTVTRLRTRAHQLQAAARAADHFLELESAEDRATGGWLIASTQELALKLATEVDDSLLPTRKPSNQALPGIEGAETAATRRTAAADTLRGAA